LAVGARLSHNDGMRIVGPEGYLLGRQLQHTLAAVAGAR